MQQLRAAIVTNNYFFILFSFLINSIKNTQYTTNKNLTKIFILREKNMFSLNNGYKREMFINASIILTDKA